MLPLSVLPDLLTDVTTQPTPYTLLCVFGYLTATLLVLDVRTLILLLPLALLGTCHLRLSMRRSTGAGGEPIVPETPAKTASGKFSSTPHTHPWTVSQRGSESFRHITPPGSRHSRKLFHIHDGDEGMRHITKVMQPLMSLP